MPATSPFPGNRNRTSPSAKGSPTATMRIVAIVATRRESHRGPRSAMAHVISWERQMIATEKNAEGAAEENHRLANTGRSALPQLYANIVVCISYYNIKVLCDGLRSL